MEHDYKWTHGTSLLLKILRRVAVAETEAEGVGVAVAVAVGTTVTDTVTVVHIITPSATTFVGVGSAKMTLSLKLHWAVKLASSCSNHSLATNHGCAHYTPAVNLYDWWQTDRGARARPRTRPRPNPRARARRVVCTFNIGACLWKCVTSPSPLPLPLPLLKWQSPHALTDMCWTAGRLNIGANFFAWCFNRLDCFRRSFLIFYQVL